jgi:HAD superfamily hydrolase (TIGR01509 family)
VTDSVEVVFLDIGGPLYDDAVYARALREALRDLAPSVADADFAAVFLRCRQRQAGLTGPIAEHFAVDHRALSAGARRRWRYPANALHPDVLPTLTDLHARYRVGLLANQPAAVRSAITRDGVAPYIDLWVISGEVGLAKPGRAIFDHAVDLAGTTPSRIAFVGNRLDNDIRPARAAGLRTVWLLRGEAPPDPAPDQLAQAETVIRSLSELGAALRRLESPVRT